MPASLEASDLGVTVFLGEGGRGNRGVAASSALPHRGVDRHSGEKDPGWQIHTGVNIVPGSLCAEMKHSK